MKIINNMLYCAHIVMTVIYKNKKQTNYPTWENIYIISAGSDEEAWRKATQIAHRQEGDSEGSFKWDGSVAKWQFEAIRKLVKCDTPSKQGEFLDGAEITYNEYIFEDKFTLLAFCKGEQIRLVEKKHRKKRAANSNERPPTSQP
jgi:hypothetical protein